MYKKYIRKISILTAAILIAGSFFINTATVYAGTLNDLDKSSAYSKEAIRWMVSNNIISGDTKGNFNPRKTISRAEVVTLLTKALDIDTSNLPVKPTFKDVPINHWAYKYVEAANRAGVISGMGNGNFGINSLCNREQITAMILNYLSISKEAVLVNHGLSELEKYKDESKMSDWAKPSIQFAVANKIMSGISSDMFSPAGSATKEQLAVILYNFLNSKASIEQSANALKKPIVTFNGDTVKLTSTPLIENGEIFVPVEVFKKIGAEVTTDEQMNKVAIRNSGNAGLNIYMSTGSKAAYVNYTGSADPYSDPAAQDKLITLNNAPRVSENEVLVPLKAVVDALGMKLEWNSKTNLAAILDSKSVKNPMLYNALKNTLEYKGEYSNSMVMSMKDSISSDEFGVSFSMKGAINGLNSTSNTKLSFRITGTPYDEYEYDTVNVDNKIYSKDTKTGEWTAYDPQEADNEGIVYSDVASDRAETQKLLDSYGKINVVYMGKATINGEEVSKYQIKLNTDILKGFVPADMLEGLGLNEIYNNGFDCRTQMFINNQGQLVKQSVKINGGIKEGDTNITVAITADSEFTNIGKNIEIVSPVQK